MVRVVVVPGFLQLPAWQVGVEAVVKRCVHLVRHGIEEVGSAQNRLDVAVDVAHEDDRALSGDHVRATREVPVLHVALHDVDAVLVREADACGLVKGHGVPQADEASGAAG